MVYYTKKYANKREKEVKPIKTLKFKTEEMRRFTDRIPDEVIKEVFPKKLEGRQARSKLYDQMKKMILSGKVKKGQRLLREEFAHLFDVNPIFGIIFVLFWRNP